MIDHSYCIHYCRNRKRSQWDTRSFHRFVNLSLPRITNTDHSGHSSSILDHILCIDRPKYTRHWRIWGIETDQAQSQQDKSRTYPLLRKFHKIHGIARMTRILYQGNFLCHMNKYHPTAVSFLKHISDIGQAPLSTQHNSHRIQYKYLFQELSICAVHIDDTK